MRTFLRDLRKVAGSLQVSVFPSENKWLKAGDPATLLSVLWHPTRTSLSAEAGWAPTGQCHEAPGKPEGADRGFSKRGTVSCRPAEQAQSWEDSHLQAHPRECLHLLLGILLTGDLSLPPIDLFSHLFVSVDSWVFILPFCFSPTPLYPAGRPCSWSLPAFFFMPSLRPDQQRWIRTLSRQISPPSPFAHLSGSAGESPLLHTAMRLHRLPRQPRITLF